VNMIVPNTIKDTIQTKVIFNGLNEMHDAVNESIGYATTTFSGKPMNNARFNYLPVAVAIYLFVTIALFFRFLRNILSLIKRKRHGIKLHYQDVGIILINEKITPHSFGKNMFINKDDYKDGKIVEEILIHERSHIKQRHYIDIIFIELLIIFFWFNPIIYLYRNRIKLNHEFLADNTVIRNKKNIIYYQTLLIRMADQKKTIIAYMYFIFKWILHKEENRL